MIDANANDTRDWFFWLGEPGARLNLVHKQTCPRYYAIQQPETLLEPVGDHCFMQPGGVVRIDHGIPGHHTRGARRGGHAQADQGWTHPRRPDRVRRRGRREGEARRRGGRRAHRRAGSPRERWRRALRRCGAGVLPVRLRSRGALVDRGRAAGRRGRSGTPRAEPRDAPGVCRRDCADVRDRRARLGTTPRSRLRGTQLGAGRPKRALRHREGDPSRGGMGAGEGDPKAAGAPDRARRPRRRLGAQPRAPHQPRPPDCAGSGRRRREAQRCLSPRRRARLRAPAQARGRPLRALRGAGL